MNLLTFANHVTQSAARAVEVGRRSDPGRAQSSVLSEASVYVLTERRWFRAQKVQEVSKIGVTPEGDLTIIAEPPLLTFDVVLYHARWSLIPIGMFMLVSLGVAIGHLT